MNIFISIFTATCTFLVLYFVNKIRKSVTEIIKDQRLRLNTICETFTEDIGQLKASHDNLLDLLERFSILSKALAVRVETMEEKIRKIEKKK